MKKSGYPDLYGTPLKGVLPDMATPLNINEQGDVLVPGNDMGEVAGKLSKGQECPDPLGFLKPFGDGTKG
jgi:hypothetical protein